MYAYYSHTIHFVSSTNKPVSTKTVSKPARTVNCNKSAIVSTVCKSHTSNILISKYV